MNIRASLLEQGIEAERNTEFYEFVSLGGNNICVTGYKRAGEKNKRLAWSEIQISLFLTVGC